MSITRLDSPSDRPQGFDLASIRGDFPILQRKIHGMPLVYLDNAASTQKPRSVIESEKRTYEECYANIHRGVHELSMRATEAYEDARRKVMRFLGAASSREIVFVRGATEAINLVAATFGRTQVGLGDEVLITTLEHHSNIVPWQMLCEEKRAHLRVVPMNEAGEISVEDFTRLLGPRTKLAAVSFVSNALGTILPIHEMIAAAHARGIPVLVDAAQAAPHLKIDVRELDCDFLAFSGHKVYGPSGTGALYGKERLLEAMPPYQGGGDMILSVSFEKTTYNELPYKFEAGTPNIAGTIALGAALDYVGALGLEAITRHEDELLSYATRQLQGIANLRVIGTAREKTGVLSFVIDGIHPHDIGTILDREGIAIRTGHHCAQPVMERLSLPATARASFGLYNSLAEVDTLVDGLRKVIEVFS
ncbi:MAG: cysteine desulfurase [Vicinamibacteria bacterium]|jgi:cysteine desulfurase/selenocysteine lyase|nr:cysteine desulfurase [Vicinamibacteria bacterium]